MTKAADRFSARLLASAARTGLLALALSVPLPHAAGQERGHDPHRFDGAETWAKIFDDPERDSWQKPAQVIKALRLARDAVVSDIGAGTGYFAVRLARAVPEGRVFAVDVAPDMVRYLGERAARERLRNLKPVQAAPHDARIPSRADLILMVNTYHHISKRIAYFKRLAASLKPQGRLAIVDFREDSPYGPPHRFRIAPGRVKQELAQAGFALREAHEFLPYQYFLVFAPAGK